MLFIGIKVGYYGKIHKGYKENSEVGRWLCW